MPRSEVPSALFPPIGPYSHAVVAGGQVYVSATPGVDPATGTFPGPDAFSQTRQTLRNVASLLASAGASLDDVVQVQVHLLDVADFAEMNRAYAESFSEPYPARTVFEVAALPKPGARLTIAAVAAIGGR